MQEVELLVTLAEITGVFVGFGALISVRSGGASDAREVAYIRSVLTIGVWVVVAGLIPATLGSFDLSGHEIWFVSSLIALLSVMAIWAMNHRTPEMQDLRASLSRGQMLEVAGYALLLVLLMGPLVLVVSGLFPDQEPALYLTAVVLGLFGAALSLLWLVFAHGHPAVASDKAELPSAGGSSA